MIFWGLSSCCSYQLGEKKWNLYTAILVRVPLELSQVFLTIHGVHISPKRKLFYNARLIKEEDWSIRATTTNPTKLQVVFFRFLTISSWFWWWRKGFLRIIVHDGMSNFRFGEGEKVFLFFFFFFWWSTEPYGIRNFCFIPKGVKPRDLDPPMKGKHFARVYAIDHAMSQLSWTLPTFYSLDMDHGLSIFCPILCSSTVHLSENQISNDGWIYTSL